MAWYDNPPKECPRCGRSDTLEKKGNEIWCTDCRRRIHKK